MYDVARGAIYASTAPAARTDTSLPIVVPAVRGDPTAPLHVPGGVPTGTPPPPPPEGSDGEEIINPIVDNSNLRPMGGSSTNEVTSSSGLSGEQLSQNPTGPAQPLGGRRRLRLVNAEDERSLVMAEPDSLPLGAVGQLLAHGQKSHCTASLIGPRTLLTAAHCVFDRASGAFASGLYFVPGRFRTTDGVVHAPHGAYDVARAYVLSAYTSGPAQDIWGRDFAVVHLVETVQIGKRTGMLGLHVQAGPPAQPTNRRVGEGSARARAAQWWGATLLTAGYPADKPEGSLVTTSCRAAATAPTSAGATMRIGCSTFTGQSGSPLWDNAQRVRGVVAFEMGGEYNGAAVLTHDVYEALLRGKIA
jgi:V8-like Glu-specific endopeptidase